MSGRRGQRRGNIYTYFTNPGTGRIRVRTMCDTPSSPADPSNASPAPDTSMLAQLKRLDKKESDTGETYYEDPKPPAIIPHQLDWWEKFALCLVRDIDHYGRVYGTHMRVNSPHLKRVLKEVVGSSWPGLSFSTKVVSVPKPYHVLFHYRRELADAKEGLDDEGKQHLDVLLGFVEDEFRESSAESENLLAEGIVSYDLAWILFRPGTKVCTRVQGMERELVVKRYDYGRRGLEMDCEYVDFDGAKFGTREASLEVGIFGGAQRVVDLEAYPVDWHADAAALEKRLVDRGARFEELAGMHFCVYSGIALEMTRLGANKYSVDGRVVIDTATFHRLNANLAFSTKKLKKENEQDGKELAAPLSPTDFQAKRPEGFDDDSSGDEEGISSPHSPPSPHSPLFPSASAQHALGPLTPSQRLLATATVRGFSFTEKKWLDFFIDNLSPITWDPHCFGHLVLPPAQKDLVRALVSTHIAEAGDTFTDIVQGKGRGLVMLLHGPPGVGKTLTAETVAEYCQRPLYSVSSGDLGVDSETLDKRLTRILDMASTWRAVLLIDEADVFLEQRSLHDLQRNSLVSIFLRVLEYYQGILFLTTNRVSAFDGAFKSRVSVPLKYNDLTPPSRKSIWTHFLAGTGVSLAGYGEGAVGSSQGAVGSGKGIPESAIEDLSQADLNGRQIKNVVKTAGSLARFHGKVLDEEMLRKVVGILTEFEGELGREG